MSGFCCRLFFDEVGSGAGDDKGGMGVRTSIFMVVRAVEECRRLPTACESPTCLNADVLECAGAVLSRVAEGLGCTNKEGLG